MPFNLETPSTPSLAGITRFSGWYVPETRAHPSLVVTLNGRPAVSLEWGLPRPDVASVFPDRSRALMCSFQGDLVHSHRVGTKLTVGVMDRSDLDSAGRLYSREFVVAEESRAVERVRSYDLFELLRCTVCQGRLRRFPDNLRCEPCGRLIPMFYSVPHFLEPVDAPLLRVTETTATHRYSPTVEGILKEHRGKLVLDFGAGNTPADLIAANVLYLDATQYRNTDVICKTPRLPLPDACFSAIVSQSVFEHIPDPWTAAKELHRVLRPGGTILIDTAFMQPLHGDPDHYFNMTLNGLRRIMAPFKEIRSGILDHQKPDSSFIMQLDTLIPFVQAGPWKDRLEQWRRDLQNDLGGFLGAISEIGAEYLSAGVYFLGTRS